MHKQISGIVRTPGAEAVPIKKVTIHRAADCLCPPQAVLGMPVPEIFRKPGISDASFNTGRKNYGDIYWSGSTCGSWKRNLRLKELLASLSLDKFMLQDVVEKRADAGASARVGQGKKADMTNWLLYLILGERQDN